MSRKPAAAIVLAFIGLTVSLSGCSPQTLQSAQNDTRRNIASARPQLAKLEIGARVTAALQAANIHGIRVDADTSSVRLHGTVNSAAQKTRAGRIARDTLGLGESISNQIQVRSD